MTRLLLAALMASAAVPNVMAATFEPDSKIDAVTVFPTGAQVTRKSVLDISAGDHVVVIDDLPANIDPASVRVTGSATAQLSIIGVDVRTVIVASGGTDADRQRLESRLEELDDLLGSLNQEQADIQVRRDLLQLLVQKSSGEGIGAMAVSGSALSDTLSVVADELATLSKQKSATRVAQREAQKEVDRLRAQLSLLAPKREERTIVEIAVSATAEADAGFDIKYNVREAGWRAIYDANLSLEDGVENIDIGIKRRALVTQSTQESWDDVALTLSTARPTAATQAPQLQANVLDVRQPPVLYDRSEKLVRRQNSTIMSMEAGGVGTSADMAEAAPVPQAIAEEVSAMETGGFNASYKIADRVSVANSQEAKSVLLGVDQWSVDVSALSVPRLDPTAYLMAEFELAGELTYLPGDVLLNRDGTYIGRGQMPLLTPGETHQLGFGADDRIHVERVERDRKTGETGILVSSNVEMRIADIRIANNHDFVMPVRIIDRIPVSDHEDILIEALREGTQASETDVDGQRGVLAFDYDLPVGGEETIRVGYRVTWPGDVQISQVQ
ncbi:MAG: mucoidy inhibitor MuiA family protein [Pseudomonadota bacterium]